MKVNGIGDHVDLTVSIGPEDSIWLHGNSMGGDELWLRELSVHDAASMVSVLRGCSLEEHLFGYTMVIKHHFASEGSLVPQGYIVYDKDESGEETMLFLLDSVDAIALQLALERAITDVVYKGRA